MHGNQMFSEEFFRMETHMHMVGIQSVVATKYFG